MTHIPRRIGLLTGGGDCPGLNAVIRAVTKNALDHGIEVVGIKDGFLGLIESRTRRLDDRAVSGILAAGGTILGSSNRSDPARFWAGSTPAGEPIFEDRTDACMDVIQRHEIDALVVVGGDGTMTCAQVFVGRGVPCIGVPKTIDNDIHGTDLCFGFLTASATATEALDRVHTTATSHHRAMIVEVMGRNAGWIALHAGIASGADVILIPEIPFSIEAVCGVVRRRFKRGKRATIICAAEGATPVDGHPAVERTVASSPDPIRFGGIARSVAAQIEQRTGVESRAIVLGHVQRGGSPIPADRVLATGFGYAGVELIRARRFNRMVAIHDGRLTDVDISTPAGRQRRVGLDDPLIAAARGVGTSLGDDPSTPGAGAQNRSNVGSSPTSGRT